MFFDINHQTKKDNKYRNNPEINTSQFYLQLEKTYSISAHTN